MIKKVMVFCGAFFVSTSAYCQVVQPTPQSIKFSGDRISIAQGFDIQNNQADEVSLSELQNAVTEKKNGLKVFIGEKGDKSIKKLAEKVDIAPVSGAYYLSVTPKEIIIIGHDDRGTYYGVQTLKQLMSRDSLSVVEVNDYPEILFRGSVEGFYGKPWSHRDRMAQLEFYGDNKLNTYIYGPKDDPYHSSLSNHADATQPSTANWRDPYPEKEGRNIAELASVAKQNKVDFVWAIHPGQDIKWNEEDYNNLLNKFEKMYDLGVRSFAVFFDDISGEGTNPVKQAELLNRINNEFVKVKKDVTPLIMCPTEYNKSWANPKPDGYLCVLGEKLDPSIQIMWTGDRVCADITMETLNWINGRIKRPTYIWWNFPVTDYVRHLLVQGPSYGLDTKATKKDMAGFVSNPMEHAEASKIALYGVADYTWNPAKYDYIPTWERAIVNIMPNAAKAYRTFAIHSADFEQNGHAFRRDESWETKAIDPTNYTQAEFDAIKAEFEKVVKAKSEILASKSDKALVAELTPWLVEFEKLGQRGLGALELIKTYEKGDQKAIWKAIVASQMSDAQMEAYKKHKSGTMVLQPFIDNTYNTIANNFYQSIIGEQNTVNPVPEQAKMYTNVDQLAGAIVETTASKVSIKPMLEVIKIEPQQYFGIELPKATALKGSKIEINVGGTKAYYSADGETWSVKNEGEIKFVRFINTREKAVEAKLFQFDVLLQPKASDDISNVFDRDFKTEFISTNESQIVIPEGTKEVVVLKVVRNVPIVETINADGKDVITIQPNESIREVIFR